MPQPNPEVAYWQAVASYLADVHAATMEGTGMLKGLSKYERKRFADVGRTARKLLREEEMPGTMWQHGKRGPEDVAKRLDEALEAMEDEFNGARE